MNFLTRLKYFFRFFFSMLRANLGMIAGMWRLTCLPQPAITFFGGAKLKTDDPHAKFICQLSRRLANAGFSIITGGGPGVMEAANLGAHESETDKEGQDRPVSSAGIGIASLKSKNKYLSKNITVKYFFVRKWLMVRYAAGFVVGPGGFGTLDELSEVLTLIQTHHMPKTPVVLIGTEYWDHLMRWIHEHAVKDGLLSHEDAHLITLTDDMDEAFRIITTTCTHGMCAIDAPSRE